METTPYVAASDTSRAAAESLDPAALKGLENMIYWFIEAYNPCGVTCDYIEETLQMKHQTCSARITGLARKGLIKDSGKRAKTRGGRNAVLWITA